MNTNLFLQKAFEIHKDKYDYSKVEYINAESKVCIICPIHGEFWQIPRNHLKGQGCPKCAIERRTKKLESFIEDANKIHGNKYNYEKTTYKNALTPTIVTCPIHGDFIVTPTAHTTKKQGCPICSKENADNKQKLGREKFTKLANSIHNNKYDYSKVDYINNYTKVIITCPIHGDFLQTPHSHLRGNGCPKCKESHLERDIENLLTTNNINFLKQYKPTFLNGQSLDFYLPKYNVAIECQGSQHIRGKWFRGNKKSKSEDIIEKDVLKNQKCYQNNLKIFYFFSRKNEKEKVINEEKYCQIYNNNNTFVIKEELIDKIKKEGV